MHAEPDKEDGGHAQKYRPEHDETNTRKKVDSLKNEVHKINPEKGNLNSWSCYTDFAHCFAPRHPLPHSSSCRTLGFALLAASQDPPPRVRRLARSAPPPN